MHISEVVYLIVIKMCMIVEGMRGRNESEMSHEWARPDGKKKYGMKHLEERNYAAHQDAEVNRGSTGRMIWGEEPEDMT